MGRNREKQVGFRPKRKKEFEKNLAIAQLGGIWKGAKISNKDIKEARKALLEKIEEKW